MLRDGKSEVIDRTLWYGLLHPVSHGLCASAFQFCPPLFLTYICVIAGNHRRIAEYVMRDFVEWWYLAKVSTDKEFPNDVR